MGCAAGGHAAGLGQIGDGRRLLQRRVDICVTGAFGVLLWGARAVGRNRLHSDYLDADAFSGAFGFWLCQLELTRVDLVFRLEK
ncbi:hypothetical protein CKO21_01245 [Rhodovibrio salinarum]|uniref:Uncharacterized protein n=1 Tax=Rhodovibrio salinarum TaxID=1087 RepID=A0A934QF14_9PROT|nr:hypothetical protein [Rhodovibrio salinarum]